MIELGNSQSLKVVGSQSFSQSFLTAPIGGGKLLTPIGWNFHRVALSPPTSL